MISQNLDTISNKTSIVTITIEHVYYFKFSLYTEYSHWLLKNFYIQNLYAILNSHYIHKKFSTFTNINKNIQELDQYNFFIFAS